MQYLTYLRDIRLYISIVFGQAAQHGSPKWSDHAAAHCIGVGSKFEVQGPWCATQSAAKKWKVISPHIFQNIHTFSTVYNILASFLDLTNPPVQYLIYVENTYTDFIVVPRRPPG